MSNSLLEMPKEKVILFGAGKAGQAAFEKLKDKFDIIAFSDNRLFDTKMCNIDVVKPDNLKNMVFDRIYIASEYFEQIQQQLIRDMGIEASQVHVLPATMIKELSFSDSKETETQAEQVLLSVCRVLDEQPCHYYVDAGTLLGIYRDDALIPWDDDLDIAVSSKDTDTVEQSLGEVLADLKRVTQFDWVYEKHYSQCDFGGVKKGDLRSFKLRCLEEVSTFPMLDIFIKYISGEVMDYVIASRGLTMPSRHLLAPLFQYSFRGQIIPLPHEPDRYLELHYGDWKTPVKNWNLSMLKNATVFESSGN